MRKHHLITAIVYGTTALIYFAVGWLCVGLMLAGAAYASIMESVWPCGGGK